VTDQAMSLLDYVRELRGLADDDRIHPSGAGIIHSWLSEAMEAASHGDGAEVARLADMIVEKVGLELDWYVESRASAKPEFARLPPAERLKRARAMRLAGEFPSERPSNAATPIHAEAA
jgi:hypothetical protein